MKDKNKQFPETDFYADTMEREEKVKKNYGLNREKGAFISEFENGLNRERGVFDSTAVFFTQRKEKE